MHSDSQSAPSHDPIATAIVSTSAARHGRNRARRGVVLMIVAADDGSRRPGWVWDGARVDDSAASTGSAALRWAEAYTLVEKR
jgi:hypothetical protein